MNVLQQLLGQLTEQPRLRWGLWLILGILWLNLDLTLQELTTDRAARYQNTERELARTKVLAAQSEWLERVEAARLARIAVEETLWQAGTPGLAQAQFQDWLNRQLTAAGVTRLSMDASIYTPRQESSATMPDDLWRVMVKTQFDFTPQTLTEALRRLAVNNQRIVVDSLVVRQQPTPRVEMQLSAYFRAGSQ